MQERYAGRPTSRLSAIHDDLVTEGAFMSFHSGWEQPSWYSVDGKEPEYLPSFRRYVFYRTRTFIHIF